MTRAAFLFDIDGTLLYARGVGRAAFGVAFEAAYGVPYPDLAGLTFVGATDSNVVRQMAAACGVASTPAREEHFFLRLAHAIDAALDQTRPLIYAGVPELVARLAGCGHALGLVTGNVRATAWSKLRHAGLDHAFLFGAYGDDHEITVLGENSPALVLQTLVRSDRDDFAGLLPHHNSTIDVRRTKS